VKAVAKTVKKGIVAVGKALKKGATAVAEGLKKVGQKIKDSKLWKKIANSKIGKKLKAAYDKTRGKIKEWREKARKTWEAWKEQRKERKSDRGKKKKERNERALREVPPKIEAIVAKRPRKFMLAARLVRLKLSYRLRKLSISGNRPHYTISGFINPPLPDVKIFGIDAHKFIEAVQIVARRWARRRKAEEREEGGEFQKMATFSVETRAFGRTGTHSPGTAGGIPIEFETRGSLTLAPGAEKPRSYLAFTKELEKMSREDREKFGTMLAQLVKSRKADTNVAGLGEIFGTMFVSERKRHSKNLVFALMAAETMAKGGASPVEMLSPAQGEGGGIFPPAFKGAVQGQGGTSALVKDPSQAGLDKWTATQAKRQEKLPEYRRTDPEKTFEEAYRREVEKIKLWAKTAGLDEKVFDREMTAEEIADIIEQALASFFTNG
jgi:hypothetical protein